MAANLKSFDTVTGDKVASKLWQQHFYLTRFEANHIAHNLLLVTMSMLSERQKDELYVNRCVCLVWAFSSNR